MFPIIFKYKTEFSVAQVGFKSPSGHLCRRISYTNDKERQKGSM